MMAVPFTPICPRAMKSALLEKTYGGGMKMGMRGELAANPAQYPALYQASAKSQAAPIYWSAIEALMRP